MRILVRVEIVESFDENGDKRAVATLSYEPRVSLWRFSGSSPKNAMARISKAIEPEAHDLRVAGAARRIQCAAQIALDELTDRGFVWIGDA